MLSMPRTISNAVRVSKLIQACGSANNDIMGERLLP
jgi:hypothetical protein